MQAVIDTTTLPPHQPVAARPRAIAVRTRGRQHGPIRRLVSPSDLGELIKPFVFLDQIDIDSQSPPRFGWHPHSGIATLTLLLAGGFSYEDSTGAAGTMDAGAVEWMQAGGGVWHQGGSIGQRIKGYQLWVALPPELENAPAQSLYLHADSFRRHGPARVILGELEGVHGPIPAPSPINYLDVRLRRGERWRYDPPPGHDVAWIAVHDGTVQVPDDVAAGELAVFAQEQTGIDFYGRTDTGFILASAPRHPHALALGHYSVHTTPAALELGEAGIRRVAEAMGTHAAGASRSGSSGQLA